MAETQGRTLNRTPLDLINLFVPPLDSLFNNIAGNLDLHMAV